MRLLTFRLRGAEAPRIGARVSRQVLDLAAAAGVAGEAPPPSRMRDLLAAGKPAMKQARKLFEQAQADREGFSAALLDEREIRFLPPIPDADKFLCVGKNYRAHLEELKRNDLITEMPQEPTAFVKLNSCLAGHNARVARPEGLDQVFRIQHRQGLAGVEDVVDPPRLTELRVVYHVLEITGRDDKKGILWFESVEIQS